ncbi:universal stress protein [Sorangium sp. So ce1153]|uniref:universal stress protein n=1 Tax=Sorangium sp. So ce1153 TaxID=3133333 RepID=UPI003F610343
MALALPPMEFAAYKARYHDDARAGLRRLLDSFDGLGVTWESSVRRGDARRAIVREAARWKADLIIMGTHGRSGISRALLGSVAESVMRSAPCDVLVARPSTFVLELPRAARRRSTLRRRLDARVGATRRGQDGVSDGETIGGWIRGPFG